jgi:hypothetical protein
MECRLAATDHGAERSIHRVHTRSARGERLSIRVPEPAGAGKRISPRLSFPLFQCLVDRPYRIEDGVSL